MLWCRDSIIRQPLSTPGYITRYNDIIGANKMFENIIDPAWDILMVPFGLVNDHVLGALGYSCGFKAVTPARVPMRVPARGGTPARMGVPPQRVNIPATSRGAAPVRPMGRGMPPVTRTGFVRYMRG